MSLTEADRELLIDLILSKLEEANEAAELEAETEFTTVARERYNKMFDALAPLLTDLMTSLHEPTTSSS